MLAGYSSASAEFQACHFPPMSSRRLDLAGSNFVRNEPGPQPAIRPAGISIEKKNPLESSSFSLKQNIKLPPTPTSESISRRREKRDNSFLNFRRSPKKRYADEVSSDEEEDSYYRGPAKRKKPAGKFEEGLSSSLWFHQDPLITGTSLTPFSITSCPRAHEESMCFLLPNDPTTRALPPLSNVPWFDSVVSEVTNSGKTKIEAGGGEGQGKEISGSSSTSSESRGLVLRLGESPPAVRGAGYGSTRPNVAEAPGLGPNGPDEHGCVEILSLLVACVEQICMKNVVMVDHYLARLGEVASPRGPSPVHRLVAYFTEALALRAVRLWPQVFHLTTLPRELDRFDEEFNGGLRLLNQVSPIPKFVHFTSNEIIMRSFEGKPRVHVIDFDVKQGLQWPALLQSLASRAEPPAHVRLTGVGESKLELAETGERLARLARALNLPFEFHPVVDRLEDVRLWMLHVKEDEAVAVNCVLQMHKLLHDRTGSTLTDFIGLIRSTNAGTVVVAEQEAAHNGSALDSRISSSLEYYSAVFDSVDSCLPVESSVRVKIEEMFGREIRNIVACEGRERIERHERFDTWRDLMGRGGLRCEAIGDGEVLQARMLLRMHGDGGGGGGFTVEKEANGECVTLKWIDRPLYTVSAWSFEDVAGSSRTI